MSRLTPKKSKKWLALNALVIGATMLAMSGACSQHEPGPYEGGGRSTTTPFPQSTSTTDSAPPEDNFVPPKDTGSGVDSSGNNG